MKPAAVFCPSCRRPATAMATRFGVRHECLPCRLWSWNGKPLVDAATHRARKVAHQVFDRVWKSGLENRPMAYAMLAEHLEMTPGECHMAAMSCADALRVPIAVEALWGTPGEVWQKANAKHGRRHNVVVEKWR